MSAPIPMDRYLKLAAIASFSVALAVDFQGCTVIGLAVGGSIDARSSRGGTERLLKVGAGRNLTLRLLNGESLHGRFLGWSRDSASESEDPTAWFRDSMVAVSDDADKPYRTFQEGGDGDWRTLTKVLSTPGVKVHLETYSGDFAIPADSIGQVVVPTWGGTVTGLVLGVTADVLVVKGIQHSLEHPDCSGPDFPQGWPLGP